jgi:hypothetical protein
LKGISSDIITITPEMLQSSQFPDTLQSYNGYTLTRPSDWI